MSIPENFNMDFNRFEILKEANSLTKNELKELSYRERKVLNTVIKNKHFKEPFENQEKKYEIKLKNHLDVLIQHKPIERTKITKVFFEVKNKVLQLATGNLYGKLHAGLNLSNARTYNGETDIYSFASDITGKPQDQLFVKNENGIFSILDYNTKKSLLKIKITSLENAKKEADSATFIRAGKIAGSDAIFIAY